MFAFLYLQLLKISKHRGNHKLHTKRKQFILQVILVCEEEYQTTSPLSLKHQRCRSVSQLLKDF